MKTRSSSQKAESQATQVKRVTSVGIMVSGMVSAFQFAAGIFGASQAVIADAVHSLSDMSTDMAVLIAYRYWSAPADIEHPYGHGRIETILTAALGIFLAGIGMGIAYNATSSMRLGKAAQPGIIALVAACVAMISKEILYRWAVKIGRKAKSSALIANAWHHRSDAFSSIPVILALAGTRINPDWWFLDRIGAIIVSGFILHAAWGILKPAIADLVDTGVSHDERRKIEGIVLRVPGVEEVHEVRTRHVGSGIYADLHAMVNKDMTVETAHAIAQKIRTNLIAEGPNVLDVLVHIGPHGKHR